MFRRKKKKLGEKLVQAGKLSQDQLAGFLEQQQRSGGYLGELIVSDGLITQDELHRFLPRSAAKRHLLDMRERVALDGTESYLLQTALKFTLFSDDPIRTLMVTSAAPGEGKTTCALYLARTIASVRPGRCLLVDADLANPCLHKRLGIRSGPGWTDYLVDGYTLDDCLTGTGIENLSVLPAGSVPPNPATIFASRKMRGFVEELKSRFDLIVFDSSPMLPLSAGSVMGSRLDAAILVIKAGSTKRQHVKKAVAMLDESKTKVIGVVLNQIVDKELPVYAYYKYDERRSARG